MSIGGASGGAMTAVSGMTLPGGLGASYSFSFKLSTGQTFTANASTAGQQNNRYTASGGGASAVWFTSPVSLMLAVAGGGGGSASMFMGG